MTNITRFENALNVKWLKSLSRANYTWMVFSNVCDVQKHIWYGQIFMQKLFLEVKDILWVSFMEVIPVSVTQIVLK